MGQLLAQLNSKCTKWESQIIIIIIIIININNNSMALAHEWTIPTEWLLLVKK
jgi:hypothetical protein